MNDKQMIKKIDECVQYYKSTNCLVYPSVVLNDIREYLEKRIKNETATKEEIRNLCHDLICKRKLPIDEEATVVGISIELAEILDGKVSKPLTNKK